MAAHPVLFAQFVLTLTGLDPGPIDGRMGGRTAAALETFQQREGLDVTGTADGQTLDALQLGFAGDSEPGDDRACAGTVAVPRDCRPGLVWNAEAGSCIEELVAAVDEENDDAPPVEPTGVELPNLTFHLPATDDRTCEAGEWCTFEGAVASTGPTPFEGLIALEVEMDIDGFRLGEVGPRDVGWRCVQARRGETVTCLAPHRSLEAGASSPLVLALGIPAGARRGEEIEACVTLAPPDMDANPTLYAQFVLSLLDIDPGPIDGVMGGRTAAALETFQLREGLRVTGEPDAQTLATTAPARPSP
jgi:peptidoglycan hydrolase-like protein with peptidoglycan-binding domain